MQLTAEMLSPITDIISDNMAVLLGVISTVAGANLLFKFVKKAAR